MNKTTLSMLNKSQLIEIIMSDKLWERKAFYKVLKMINQKIESILDEQEKCDLATMKGRVDYQKLEKEYKKWSNIQDNL